MSIPDPSFATCTATESLLALLISGHVLADFLVQTESVASRKGREFGELLLHGGLTLLTHAAVLLPFWSPRLVLPVLALGVYHVAVDFTKGRLDARSGGTRKLGLFFADQGMHALGLLAVWIWLRHLDVTSTAPFLLPTSVLSPVAAWSLVVAGLVFNGKGGTAVVRSLLERYPSVLPQPEHTRTEDNEAERDEYEMGRTIGLLERLIVFLLVLVGQWGALGLVLAAKSIARFPELKDQRFADYYLMGTLASILTAMVTGMVVKIVVF